MYRLLVLVALVAASWARYPDDSAIYEDMLVQDLYKRLSELADPAVAAGYQYEDDNAFARRQNWMNDIALESRESGQADLRDHEYLQHSSVNDGNDGFQYISGGAGEGKQHLKPFGTQDNTQEVKSDEGLPFYCHPPNPCPKGFTAEDGCHDFTEDTAEFQQEWIIRMQRKGMCACDHEHMFKCPNPENKIDGGGGGDDSAVDQSKSHKDMLYLDELFKEINKEDKQENPYVNLDDKHEVLVAKKSPIVKRSIDDIDQYLEELKQKQSKRFNPYLDGKNQQLQRVAKKG